jgi:hypothetical protein
MSQDNDVGTLGADPFQIIYHPFDDSLASYGAGREHEGVA